MKTKQLFSSSARHRFLLLMLLTLFAHVYAWGGQYVYDFSTTSKWYTTSARNTNVGTGSGNNNTSIYDLDGIEWTAGGTSHYFNSGYYLLGKTSAYLNLPTYTDEKITSIVIHSSSGHSTSVKVNIYTTGGTAASTGLTWGTKNEDYVYAISASYQASALRVQVTNNNNTQFTRITINTAKNSSCAGIQLATPDVSSTPSNGQIQLTWPAVTNATKYQVSWNGGSFVDATSPFTKTSLTNGTAYTWAVRAVGNGSTYCTSEAFEGSTKPGSTVYTITWKVNGEAYATTNVANGDHLMLPASPSSCEVGKVFAGWSATNIGSTPTDTKPTFVSSQTTASGNVTYHAVFATRTANSYSLGDINDLFPGQTTLIVSSSKALSDEYVSSNEDKRLKKVDVTISSSKITSMSNSHLIWTVTNSGQQYNFTTATGNLRATSPGNDKLSCKPGSDPWTITAANTGTYYMNSNISSTSRLEYYSSGSYFTTYGTNGTGSAYEMSFYVPTCTQYFTTCAVACSDPTIDTHPTGGASYTLNYATPTALSVVATKNGSGPALTYQWYSNSENSNSTGTIIDGATSSSYTPPTTVAGTKYYYCIVSSGTCTATSNAASVTITGPVITVNQTSRAFGDRKVSGGPYSMTFTVSGSNLSANIGLAISGTNAGMFSLSTASLTQSAGSVSSTEVTVYYSPTGAGSHTAQIDITSTDAETQTVSLSGTGKWEVTWNVNGETSTSLVANSEKPTFPSAPSSCDLTSTTFIGWATTSWTGKLASLAGKTVHTAASTMDVVTANGTTFYAVFAKAGAGGAGEKIKITPTNSELPDAGTYNGSATSFTIGDYTFKHDSWCRSADPPASYNIQAKKNIKYSVYNVDAFENYIDHIIVYQTGTNRDVTITGSYYYDEDEAEEAGDTFAEEAITPPSTDATMSFDFTGKNHRYFYMSTPGNAVYMDSIVVYTRSSITYSDYLTTCCDNNVTLADGSPTNGTVTFSPAGPIATCSATASDRTTTMTITPNAGYYLSNFTPSGVSTSNSPSIATSGSTSESAQEISLEFAQNTTSGTYTAGATFSAKPLNNITLAEGSVTVYVDEIKYVNVTYNPTDVITKGFSTVATPSFCKIDSYDSYNKMKVTGGRAGVTISENKTETVTIKATADNTKTTSIDVTVKPLPTILFVDLIHNKVDFAIDGTGYTAATGVLSSTVTDGVVNHSKRTPTHADVVAPVGGNTCETTHLHLIGWIRSDNAAVAAYMEGTGDAPDDDDITGAGEGYFFKPDALINTETYNGKTFYAVWGKAD